MAFLKYLSCHNTYNHVQHTIYCIQCFTQCIDHLIKYWKIEQNNAELFSISLLQHLPHKAHRKRPQWKWSWSSFPSHFPSRKTKNSFFCLPYPLPHLTSQTAAPVICYTLASTLPRATWSPALLLSPGPSMTTSCWEHLPFWKPLELPGLASAQIPSMDGGH